MSTLILILLLFVATIGFLMGKLGAEDMTKLMFAIVGFVAGLFTASQGNKERSDTSPADKQ